MFSKSFRKVLKTILTGTVVTMATVALTVSTSAAKKAKYKEIDVKNGGTIKGVAKWKGDIPTLPKVTVFKHMDKCGQEVYNPALQVDNGSKGVKFVVVYLKGKIMEGAALPKKKMKLKRDTVYPIGGSSQVLHAGRDADQRPDSQLCNFEEHIWPVVRTRPVAMYNLEDLLHNPHAFTAEGSTLFNFPLPDQNRLVKKKVKRVKDLARYQCDTHIHMNGWMFGFDHPYFAVTDAKGAYEIKQVPPGKYTLVGWHEGYNIDHFAADSRPVYDEPHIIEKEIEVTAGGTVEVNWEFPVRDVKVSQEKAKRTVAGM
ncbi:MAG: hypothetical protein ACE5G9_06850 [Nitrospinales bacterium]